MIETEIDLSYADKKYCISKIGGKMEIQEELKIEIGTEETVTLKPAKVRIEIVRVENVGNKNAKKIVCECKHPDKPDHISISSLKFENKGKLEVTGLWFNRDSKGLIRKNSALAVFMLQLKALTPEQLAGNEVDTAIDEKGYLCFKGY